uniref:Uncharacterized protein n=1 Tax=Melopsittacus undulatus TaxID=13146 RepID=A0A8C6N7H6_MELUD
MGGGCCGKLPSQGPLNPRVLPPLAAHTIGSEGSDICVKSCGDMRRWEVVPALFIHRGWRWMSLGAWESAASRPSIPANPVLRLGTEAGKGRGKKGKRGRENQSVHRGRARNGRWSSPTAPLPRLPPPASALASLLSPPSRSGLLRLRPGQLCAVGMRMSALPLLLCAVQLCAAALGSSHPQLLVERSGSRSLGKVGGFAWENCGDRRDPVVLQSLSVAPDPISIPGSLRVSAAVNSGKTMASPLKAVLVVEKALGDLWIQLPCIDQLGSCTYNDVCTILDELIPPGTTCPEPLLTYGIPCHCPFKAGSYSLPASDFVLPDMELPSWMTNGNYRVRAVVSNGLFCRSVPRMGTKNKSPSSHFATGTEPKHDTVLGPSFQCTTTQSRILDMGYTEMTMKTSSLVPIWGPCSPSPGCD